MFRCPSARRQRTVNCSVSSEACTTPPRFPTMRRIASSAPILVAALLSGSSISGAPSSNAVEFLGREHQARGRTRSRPRLSALARARVDCGAAWSRARSRHVLLDGALRYELHDLVDDLTCDSLLRRLLDSPLPRGRDQNDFVVARVETDVVS